jgi:hypothetical protein
MAQLTDSKNWTERVLGADGRILVMTATTIAMWAFCFSREDALFLLSPENYEIISRTGDKRWAFTLLRCRRFESFCDDI